MPEYSPNSGGERLDKFLAAFPEIGSRSQAARLCEEGRVRVNSPDGEKARKNRAVSPGEVYYVDLPEAADPVPVAQDIPLNIIYEDDDLIVVDKPRGMVVHPAPGHPDGTLVNALLARCGESLSGIGGEKRPGIVHRIDKDTSGLIIAAKNDFSHRSLSAQLKDRSLSRVYEAVVRGSLREDSGRIDLPIGRHRVDRKKQSVNAPVSRPAATNWEVVARYRGWTHVRCRLETGRTHQIRVHMAAIGHSILGDMLYGGEKKFGMETQCLHACEISFVHPRTSEKMSFVSPLPPYFKAVLEKLRAMALE
ncbi:MAG: RluA family pseudouridine synthase [Oscillospiraceae bacterium]|jgi:23S rRNA pseudouridine1911/1915/1917 synthase